MAIPRQSPGLMKPQARCFQIGRRGMERRRPPSRVRRRSATDPVAVGSERTQNAREGRDGDRLKIAMGVAR